MLVDRLKDFKKRTGLTTKQIADKANLPERTVNRVFTGETNNPYIDTLHRIANALDVTLDELLVDSNIVVGDENLATLKENVEVVTAERGIVEAENAILKEKVATLTAENELLKMKLMHKEEIIALHNYYNKLNSDK